MAPNRRSTLPLVLVLAWLILAPTGPARASPYGEFDWPVQGPVIRRYEPPSSPYEAGHRGIDIAAPFGTPVRAPAEGTVAFAGWIAGALFLSVDHMNGVRTTYSWVSDVRVTKGQSLGRGDVVGLTGHGHPEAWAPHLHFGARVNGEYIDPLILLGGGSVVGLIRLAPLEAGP